ncbi:MAG: carboxylating nicotinate-nucleotide diphosphorylase [Rhodospirillaceae bacterium]|jgi:nicotinate-nucleotide pyrophosphorylase (carboxylating)|nr:carboxylating nicotinate-nucleotide diphosphorylase [Rhodospirillales bacterium]MBT3906206.1 carboxylating nicotinate-nucleotide diphosphorylase [Rhodospirillaceae bacterium]MBT4702002.1 carboxylating nicotinate-nucleotide diphosphorylase [Rhodospirillaceae bacterium]MBT5034718.1 carboxylating nicotinate-nucleotide diphosphorylase [Rhodospirillaceae bacterium]MBT6221481.1 carboxylating nicotinate-nucleotide diphosphorylase [Rhodospirillaceae bacterium]
MILDSEVIEHAIDEAIREDVGRGDLTSIALIPEDAQYSGTVRARQDMVVAGLGIAERVFEKLAPTANVKILLEDGVQVKPGADLAKINGPARDLLTAERTALNFLQHLSGIATLTRTYVDEITGTGAVLLDTRKTIPGLRLLAKYATSMGGAKNHRLRLDDGVLIKDNHLSVAGGVAEAVTRARKAGLTDIEVECDTLDQVRQSIEAGADSVLLDNMPPPVLVEAVAIVAGRIKTEASGGVTLKTIRAIAETGVNYISVGRITQSAPAIDIGLDWDSE